MDSPFLPGEEITRYETHHGEVWMHHPVEVIEDSGDHLAVLLRPGSPFTYTDARHALGPHPWRPHEAWSGPTVLQIYRAATPYSVWKFFGAGRLRHDYLNFETALVRRPHGFEVDDHGIDLVLERDGAPVWKDVEDLDVMRKSGRLDAEDVLGILSAARHAIEDIRSGRRWWSSWDGWTPPDVVSEPST